MTSRFISCNAIRNHAVKITILPWCDMQCDASEIKWELQNGVYIYILSFLSLRKDHCSCYHTLHQICTGHCFLINLLCRLIWNFFMKGIRAPNVTINETCLNIPEEGHKSNGVNYVGLGMLLFKLSFLECWLLTMRIIFRQPLLFFYDKYISSVYFDKKLFVW